MKKLATSPLIGIRTTSHTARSQMAGCRSTQQFPVWWNKNFAVHSERNRIAAGEATDDEEASNRQDEQHQPFQFGDVNPGLKICCIGVCHTQPNQQAKADDRKQSYVKCFTDQCHQVGAQWANSRDGMNGQRTANAAKSSFITLRGRSWRRASGAVYQGRQGIRIY